MFVLSFAATIVGCGSARGSWVTMDRDRFEMQLLSTERRDADVASLVRSCMQQQGFGNSPFLSVPTAVGSAPPPGESGLTAEALAMAAGKGSTGQAAPTEEQAPPPEFRSALSALATVAGRPIEGGCEKYAEDNFSASHPEEGPLQKLRESYGQIGPLAHADPEWTRLNGEWRSCMSSKGFKYDKPGDQLDDIRQMVAQAVGSDGPTPDDVPRLEDVSRRDRAITQATLTCLNSIQPKFNRVLAKYSENWRRANVTMLASALGKPLR